MAQRLMGAGLGLFGLAIIILSVQLPQPLAATRIAYGPGFFPLILGIVIAGAGGLLAVVGSNEAVDEDSERFTLRAFGKPLIVCLAALVYVMFSQQIGFLVLAPIILTGLLLLGRVPILTSLAIGIVGSVVVHVIFAKLLLVPLPLGLLTPWGGYL